jgi:hypothetical protein
LHSTSGAVAARYLLCPSPVLVRPLIAAYHLFHSAKVDSFILTLPVMKTSKLLFFALFLFVTVQLLAQNPLAASSQHKTRNSLVSNWQYKSNNLLEGSERYKTRKPLEGTWIEDNLQTGLKEIKIISPTHVGFIVMDTKKDTLAFTGFGTYTIQNGKYTENLELANFTWDKNTKLEFDYKVEGDKFYQKGTITNADGSKEEINHTFTRVKLPPQDTETVGTWEQRTDAFRASRIVTPTHLFEIVASRNGEIKM